MITDIPSPSEFHAVGTQLLNTAWDTATTLLIDLDEAQYYTDLSGDSVAEQAYWNSAKLQLSTALSVAQQGCEFLLKSKISEISPYLLISSNPRDWPAGATTKDISYSLFHTADAQNLIKILNAFSDKRLSREFIDEFENLRKKRNTIMHSIDHNLSIHINELLTAVLLINDNLTSNADWVSTRREYLNSAPLAQMHPTDWANYRLVKEFSVVQEVLENPKLLKYFDFKFRQRTYTCPNCTKNLAPAEELDFESAVLKPKTPKSTTIWCYVCGETQKVEREPCPEPKCKGNVLCPDYGFCLTCCSDYL